MLTRFIPGFAIIIYLLFTPCAAQQSQRIDFSKIPEKKVAKLLKTYSVETKSDLAKLTASCYEESDSVSYSSHTKTFVIEGNIDEVWQTYKEISPTVDDEDMVSFGLLYAPQSDKVLYQSDAYNGIKEGQIVFWNLKFLSGLIQVAVGQRVMEVNDEEKFIKICYLAEGKSQGTQYIQLYETEEGNTKIIHYTRYKSGSRFRDRRLYPGLHDRAITEFHETVFQKIADLHKDKP